MRKTVGCVSVCVFVCDMSCTIQWKLGTKAPPYDGDGLREEKMVKIVKE